MRACKLAMLVGVCLGLWGITPSRAEPLYDKPVYNPGTKSYFELKKIESIRSLSDTLTVNMTMWPNVSKMAEKLEFEGVHGRLAVVKNLETHEFLERTFQPKTNVWIGLRFWCASRRLQYTDGTYWQPGDFHAWAPQWDQSAVEDPCWEWHMKGLPQFMPVAYNPLSEGFRWIAKEWHKGYEDLLVEYPTGHP